MFQFQKVRLQDCSSTKQYYVDLVSIPKGTITRPTCRITQTHTSLFQFQKVRLQACILKSQLKPGLLFQFQKVRLQDGVSMEVQYDTAAFQFQKVRLQVGKVEMFSGIDKSFNSKRYDYKIPNHHAVAVITCVSIPKGTITRGQLRVLRHLRYAFQFQKVRLQALKFPYVLSNQNCFNSKRYDYKLLRINRSRVVFVFQFQKVRLQETASLTRKTAMRCFNSKRYDYKNTRSLARRIWMGFQFQKVRLQERIHTI